MKKAMANSTQDEQDGQVRVYEIAAGDGGSRPPVNDIKGVMMHTCPQIDH